ncbi:formylglycine-generating enzyme family protein [Yokenella regensburgei]|uniref:formylglycine-generating enzyme family protein n=1 Tax=Yokenella regensburgei TaxID=158877 RepID=UPI001432EA12|nr:SUMF1/EgtB/PvdO family nonheme iron enzyme [Yokenella regensburgei]QIU89833.1 formylglycine-generating enzyme family protein [Yokenella regensburgei]
MKKLTILLLPFIVLSGCDKPAESETENKVSASELNTFIQQVNKNLVFVEGGEFEMGDFGEKVFGAQIDPYPDSKPLHKVELSSYAMSKFKISNRDYHLYQSENDIKARSVDPALEERWSQYNSTPETPARIDWYEADNYCRWLGKITNMPFSLPTEAQWEYAARSRGKLQAMATNSGKAEVEFHSGGKETGVNVATTYDREMYAKKSGTRLQYFSSMPGDAFPPNSIGIYDMAANGFEWVSDWYDPNYYKNSEQKDPQGPSKQVFTYNDSGYQKVMRSSDRYNGIIGSTVGRTFRPPRVPQDSIPNSQTARCVVNLSKSIIP